MGLPTSVKTLWKCTPPHTQRFVSKVTLNIIELREKMPTTLLPSTLHPPLYPRYLLSGVTLLGWLVILRVCLPQVHLRTLGEEADVPESSSSLASATSLVLTHDISILPLALAWRHPESGLYHSRASLLISPGSSLSLCISCTKICLHCKRTTYTGSFQVLLTCAPMNSEMSISLDQKVLRRNTTWSGALCSGDAVP